MIGARPSRAALARTRHPVAQAAQEQEPRASRFRRCIALAEDSQAALRDLRRALSPEEDTDARVGDQLASV
jgi:hypothetical protein